MNDSLKIEGIVGIDIVSKDGKVKRHIEHNAISPACKRSFLEYASMLQDVGTQNFNKLWSWGNVRRASTGSDFLKNDYWGSSCCLHLLNLPASVYNNLSSSDLTYVPFGAKLNDYSYVVARGRNEGVIQSGVKEGQLDFPTGTFIDLNATACSANRWKFPAGNIASEGSTETINAIAIASENCMNPAWGIQSFKYIEPINLAVTGTSFTGNYHQFIPPGINGTGGTITADDELIVFCTKQNSSAWRYKLSTGVWSDASGDTLITSTHFNNSSYRFVDYYVDSTAGYVYLLFLYSSSITVDVVSLSTGAEVGTFNLSGQSSSAMGSFFKSDGNLYVHSATDSTAWRVYKLTGSGSYYTGGTQVTPSSIITDTSLGQTFDTSHGWHIRQFGDAYLYIGMGTSNLSTDVGVNRVTQSTSNKYGAVIFTDLSDIVGSTVGFIPTAQSSGNYSFFTFCNDLISGTINWTASQTNAGTSANGYLGSLEKGKYIFNSANSGTQWVNRGLSLSLYSRGCVSNIASIVQLSEPLSISSSDEVYVTYGYKVV